MKQDPPTLDGELRKLQSASLDDAFLARLESSAAGTWTELTRDELQFELFLRQNSPAGLSTDFLTRLESVTRNVHFTVNEKIVLFPKERGATGASKKYSTWAAAAAVAFIGAASALMLPSKGSNSQVAQNLSTAPAYSAAVPQNFVPASFNRGLSAVHDEGIVWKDNKQPQRLLRFVYMEKMTYKDANGRIVEVEQPKALYRLLPENTD